MKIIISADLVPTESNKELFDSANIKEIFGEDLCAELENADIRIFNLEVPFYDGDSKIKKSGPSLKAPTSTIAGIKALNPTLASIANNHILDCGREGLESTIKLFEENGIAHVGAGENLAVAKKPYIIEKDGKRIGIYSCAEHEFSIATDDTAGANPLDELYSFDEIEELKKNVDTVIVLFHGGRELYRYPTPMQQRRCRRMIEKGADVVICQHSHCVGCEEKYEGGTIIYGQGNFIFDLFHKDEWKTGLLTVIDIDSDNKIEVSYVPLEKCGNVVRKSENKNIIEGFYSRSSQICGNGFVINNFKNEAKKGMRHPLLVLLGKISGSFFFKALNKILGGKLQYKIYGERQALSLINQFECESHSELLLSGLKQIADGEKNK